MDAENGTVTLPLYSGQAPTGTVHYVVFETTSLRVATDRGLNWSPKLANALDTNAVQRASGRQPRARNRESAGVTFTATPNFALERQVVPGPEGSRSAAAPTPARAASATPRFSSPGAARCTTPRTSPTTRANTTQSSKSTATGWR
ncbi:hypothetical protein [Halorussus caseinilyticus]|uniref:Uncharacterized protein n=1 Tax=Halorussus caseinilyticus TaxID=3034025 RepID=A0ABD5WGU2_9EURY